MARSLTEAIGEGMHAARVGTIAIMMSGIRNGSVYLQVKAHQPLPQVLHSILATSSVQDGNSKTNCDAITIQMAGDLRHVYEPGTLMQRAESPWPGSRSTLSRPSGSMPQAASRASRAGARHTTRSLSIICADAAVEPGRP